MHTLRPEQAHSLASALRPTQNTHGTSTISAYGAQRSAQFAIMEAAFARHGGMSTSDEVACRMRDHREQPISALAKWIVSRSVIAIDRDSCMILPMFQFDPTSWNPRPECSEAVAELLDFFDDWNIALWFATSNPWLGGLPPVDALLPGRGSVVRAAKAAATRGRAASSPPSIPSVGAASWIA